MKNKYLLYIGMLTMVTIILSTITLPFMISLDFEKIDLFSLNTPPSKEHLLGTDSLGRDVFSRIVYGVRVSLLVGVLATFFQLIIGVVIGVFGGYFKGKISLFISIIIDVFMSFPFLIIAIVISSILGPSIVNVIIIISIFQWTEVARIVRAAVLKVSEEDFVKSSRIIGFDFIRIIRFHVIPNILKQIIVASTIAMANAVLIEASLSFLGLGVKPPMPSLGNILESAQNITAIQNYWWQWIPAGIITVLIVFSINSIGRGLEQIYK
ncbi:ABC transporter permease [Gemella sp. 20925_1_85]|uniref:ABC transporter permease n=1 Tax=Gemella sp. 20925_1_85 TaxID=3003690 RepID=UPI00352EB315